MSEDETWAGSIFDAVSDLFAPEPVSPCTTCPAMDITVSVRRDFPVRESEKFGAWLWSDASGSRGQDPMEWDLPSGATQGRDSDLTASREDPIKGWSIGRPQLGRQASNGGQLTTDREDPISANVKLMSGSTVVSSAHTSGRDGLAVLNTSGLSGRFTVVVEPLQKDDSATVGPLFLAEATGQEKIYRTLEVTITLRSGELAKVVDPYDPPSGKTGGRVGNHRAFVPSRRELPISLKPIWWKSPAGSARAGGRTVDMVVIHCTSGARLGNALNRWIPKAAGPHYVLEIDGHLIKLINDDKRVAHVMGSRDRWERNIHRVSNNDRSIGIEVVNPISMPGYSNGAAYVASNDEQPYTFEQYQTLIRLCRELVDAYPDIEHRIIGHNDISCGNPKGKTGTPPDQLGQRKTFDPGERFEWERLEAEGLGMIASPTVDPHIYDDLFLRFPGVLLRAGDNDRTFRYGGNTRVGFTGSPVAQIKTDLREIGYSLRNIDGEYDAWTAGAVDRFKRHFFSGTRGQTTGGNLDQATASMIRRVKLAYFPV